MNEPDVLAARLVQVGFYAVANDVRAGRIDRATVIAYLRRDASKVTVGTGAARLALAHELEREGLR